MCCAHFGGEHILMKTRKTLESKSFVLKIDNSSAQRNLGCDLFNGGTQCFYYLGWSLQR